MPRLPRPQRALARLAACASLALLSGCRERAAAVPEVVGPMDLDAARQYVLGLVNRDRAAQGLGPVERNLEAERAAQRHAEDMARHGFTAHWGSDGSVPEQRYTEAGGEHMVQENAACFFDGVPRQLRPTPSFLAAELDKIEMAFVNEEPPNDGHRRNILKAAHSGLGIGLAQPLGLEQVCMAQEFVDRFGKYEPLPLEATPGTTIVVAGEVFDPVAFGGVGVARIEAARPMAAHELNQTSSYPIPAPDVVYFPEGFATPRPVEVHGRKFRIRLELDGGPGRYEISVWGRFPDRGEALDAVSIRTVTVRAGR